MAVEGFSEPYAALHQPQLTVLSGLPPVVHCFFAAFSLGRLAWVVSSMLLDAYAVIGRYQTLSHCSQAVLITRAKRNTVVKVIQQLLKPNQYMKS